MTWSRKEYDRLRAARIYEEFKIRRESIVKEKFGGCCYLCKCEATRKFHLHHVIYHETESKYPRHSRAMSIRLQRLKEAEEHPERFRLLCGRCHRLLESILSALKTWDTESLIDLIRNTKDFTK